MRPATTLILITLLLPSAVRAQEDTTTKKPHPLDEIQAILEAGWANVTSYRATSVTTMSVPMGEGSTYAAEQTGTTELVRTEDTVLVRGEIESKTRQDMAGEVTESRSTILTVANEEASWSESREGETVTVMKMKAHSAEVYAPRSFIAPYYIAHTVKRLEDEEIDGASCLVVEMLPDPVEGAPAQSTTTFWYRKDCALMVKMVMKDGEGNVMTTTTTSSVELNADIDRARFTYTPPEGVTVVDMAAMGY